MYLSKQEMKRTFQESWEEKYFCCAQDDNVRCLLCSIVQEGTHKWNIKRHYDTVLCSKSAADAANLSIFTLRHVHCGLRCATSSWGHIENMIADAWSRLIHSQTCCNQELCSVNIQDVNDIDCQKNMGDTYQHTYQKRLIQFCFISYFNFYALKPDVFSTGTVLMFTIHQLCGSLQLGNTRVKKRAACL